MKEMNGGRGKTKDWNQEGTSKETKLVNEGKEKLSVLAVDE